MDRREFYSGQKVKAVAELNPAFAGVEQALWDLAGDLGLIGIAVGGVVTQHAPTADLTVDVTSAKAYDPAGKRIDIPTAQTCNLAVDHNAVSTAVGSGGNSKIVSLFARWKRVPSDPRTNLALATVNFVQDEGFEFYVVQGAEAPSPTPPALITDGILLADITRTFGQTQIVNAQISTTRRQDMFTISAGAITIKTGTPEETAQQLLTELNNHITSVANGHPASAISYAGGANWADGSTNPAASVEAQIDKILSDIASVVSGTAKIGGASITAGGASIAAGTLRSQLVALASAANHGNTPAGNIAATTVQAAINELDTEKAGLATNNVYTGTNGFQNRINLGQGSSPSIVYRLGIGALGNANANLDVSKDYYDISGTLTATRNYTLLHTSGVLPAVGSIVHVRKDTSGAFAAIFRREDNTIIAQSPADSTLRFISFVFDGSGTGGANGWKVLMHDGSWTNLG